MFRRSPEVVRAFMGPLEHTPSSQSGAARSHPASRPEPASRDEVLSMIAAALTAFERGPRASERSCSHDGWLMLKALGTRSCRVTRRSRGSPPQRGPIVVAEAPRRTF